MARRVAAMADQASRRAAAFGLRRFGLGARPGDLAAAAVDARAFLLQELREPHAAVIAAGGLPTGVEALRAFRELRSAKPESPEGRAAAMPAAMRDEGAGAGPPLPLPLPRRLFLAEAAARLGAGAEAEAGLVERLVLFWSDHFAVSSARRRPVRVLAGAYEREAIRPHVLSRFADLLLAAESHPAMLLYLDNARSVGPTSPAGRERGRGLNENHAREILELHTLGVDGGYGQEDVLALARVLTGWGVAGMGGPDGGFVFRVRAHEPGDHRLLGRTYPQEDGRGQGVAVLRDLARHPSTARHVARRLAAHFVADAPDPALVARLERVFLDTGGNLAALAAALVEAPEAWAEPAAKIRMPYEFLVAAARATGFWPGAPAAATALAAMGQPLWEPPGPDGFPDAAEAWTSPEAVRSRLDVAAGLATRAEAATPRPPDLLEEILGPLASAATREAVARAESPRQGLALLLMSPEFQRR